MASVLSQEWLWRIPGYWRTVGAARGRLSRPIIQQYLSENPVRIVNVGAGPLFEHEAYRNWLSCDIINPLRSARPTYSVYVDFTRRFPIPTGSIDYLLSQQCIEHFKYDTGQHLLREVRRIMKPGGIVRIETPDVRYFIRRYLEGQGDVPADIHVIARRDMKAPASRLTMLNQIFMLWEHRYVYDPETLIALCQQCGFASVREVPMGSTDVDVFKPALALNPAPDGDPYYLECSFALELTA